MKLRMLDLFAGIGGFSLAAHMTGAIHTVGFVEQNPFCQVVLAKNFPGIPIIGDIHDVTAQSLARAGISRPDIITGGFPCFPVGTLIATLDGFKPIEQVTVGEMVLTHRRRYMSVNATMHRAAQHMVRIQAQGIYPVLATPEHPFYVRKRTMAWDNSIRQYRPVYGQPEWLQAKDLTTDHYLAQPMDDSEDSDGHSSAFWYLIGRYLGDGWLVTSLRKSAIPQGRRGSRVNSQTWKVIICCAKYEEQELADAIASAGFHATRSEDRTVIKFHISSKELVQFLEPSGRGAQNKRLQGMMFHLSQEKQAALLKGWLESDGHMSESGFFDAMTVSRELAVGMARIARNVYQRVAMISRYEPSSRTTIEGREVNQLPHYRLRISTTATRSKAHMDGGFCWVPVREVTTLDSLTEVFNIGVQDDESYCADGVMVHNCQPVSLAGKRKAQADARWLWPEMARLIGELRPRWMVGENVSGLLSQGLDDVLADLDALHYRAWTLVFPASAVGAPHQRERVFLVAHADDIGHEWRAEAGWEAQRGAEYASEQSLADTLSNEPQRDGIAGILGSAACNGEAKKEERQRLRYAFGSSRETVADATRERRGTWGAESAGFSGEARVSGNGPMADDPGAGLPRRDGRDGTGGTCATADGCAEREAESHVGRVLDGISARLDGVRWPAPPGPQHAWEPPRVVTGKVPRRGARITALGNAVVPQQVYPILKFISEIREGER